MTVIPSASVNKIGSGNSKGTHNVDNLNDHDKNENVTSDEEDGQPKEVPVSMYDLQDVAFPRRFYTDDIVNSTESFSKQRSAAAKIGAQFQ